MVLMLRSPRSGRLDLPSPHGSALRAARGQAPRSRFGFAQAGARTAALHQLQSIDQSTAPMPSLAAAAGLRLRWLLSLLGFEALVPDASGAQQRSSRCSADRKSVVEGKSVSVRVVLG